MLEFGSKNILLCKDIATTSFVINSYEELGINCVFFFYANSSIQHWIKCKKVLYTHKEIQSKIRSNLFRVDLMFFDGLNGTYLERIREVTDLPICLVGNYPMKSYDEYDFAYSCYSDKHVVDKLKSMFVSSITEKWASSVEDLMTKHKRDIKLNNLGI